LSFFPNELLTFPTAVFPKKFPVAIFPNTFFPKSNRPGFLGLPADDKPCSELGPFGQVSNKINQALSLIQVTILVACGGLSK